MTKKITRSLLVVFAVLLAFYLLLPVLVIVPMSFSESAFLAFPPEGFTLRWFDRLINDWSWVSSAINSLIVALLSMVCSVVLGTLAALAITRGRMPFRGGVMAILLSPIIVPFVVVALAIYITFLPLGLTQTILGFVLIHTALGVPYVMINVVASLSSVDRRLEMAAMNLGSNGIGTFFRITLPVIMPGILAGALFAFITSWDEVVVAIFLSGTELTTLPVRMWSGIRVQVDPMIAAVSTISLFIIVAAFLSNGLARLLTRKRTKRPSAIAKQKAEQP
ncbi:MAG TPA: ABC transporter permease [Candidatus Agrococcus pullicola]|uniref:ABC transporter permease n=1 Tax=Candidatus Agrococcus pullicola TaxID=2838429 RepID=A0A9D1YTP6_9MICO|nr:ABC transporter permease [Candidatus Agrococcus pullicola]